jgi:hypothetical protein
LETVRAQIYEDQLSELEGITEIARILQRKLIGRYVPAFAAISGNQPTAKKEGISPFILKNIFLSISILVNNKLKEKKEQAFRTLLKQFGGVVSNS